MPFENVTAEVRPRSHWEAVDLGFAMVRRHFPRLLLAWTLCVGPIWALLLASSHWIPLWVVLLVLWWLKPLYARVPLFYLGRALFGAPPRLRDTLRAWPGLLISRLPLALISGRINSHRSLTMPITMLEGLKGKERRARSKVLVRHSGGTASSLMLCCAAYEVVLSGALMALIATFVPEGTLSEFWESLVDTGFRRGEAPPLLLWVGISTWLMAITLVELFYVGGGFGLYINCRTHLEGWDVEQTFRRLGARLTKVAAVVMLLLLPLTAGAAIKQGEVDVEAERAEVREQIDDVLTDEDFKVHKVKQYVPKGKLNLRKSGPNSEFLQMLGYIAFWLVVIFAVWKLVEFILKNLHLLRGGPSTETKADEVAARTLMGMDLRPESLPDDIARAAWERWQAGDHHGAMSLLYRGAVSWFVHTAALPVRDSDTEGDCLRLVGKLGEPVRCDYFSQLTRHWITVAYAERLPATAEIEALIRAWPFAERRAG